MNFPAAASVVASAVGLLFALLAMGLASAPGWRELRWFAVIAATASGYAACDVLQDLGGQPQVVVWASRISVSLAGVHGFGWLRYMAAQARRSNTMLEKVMSVVCLTSGALSLVPTLVISDLVETHHIAWLGVTYHDSQPTTLGVLVYNYCVLALLVPLVHFFREWRRGRPGGAHALGLIVVALAGANDTLVGAMHFSAPYLLDVGFLFLVVAVGGSLVRRFVASARELERLSTRLELEVEDRTQKLVLTQQELHRSEKLAAVGQLAAGVAHEINNPAAAVLGNLSYLREAMRISAAVPSDTEECLDESIVCMDRIARIVRQLLDAGRVAGRLEHREVVNLSRAITNAITASAPSRTDDVVVAVSVSEEVRILGSTSLVEQVLVNLLANAAQAILERRSAGRIEVSASLVDARVIVKVKDDGPGISEEAQLRLFEPFFTTKPQGKGTGLGLAVSLGLMRTLGGELAVDTTSPQGTTMSFALPVAPERS